MGITQEPNAGDDGILNLCEAGAALDIFPSLGGADLGGFWTTQLNILRRNIYARFQNQRYLRLHGHWNCAMSFRLGHIDH